MEYAEVTNSSNSVFEDFIEGAKTTGYAIGWIVFIVTHPILGPLGAIACLFSAAYHGILLNYHWRHSRETDQNGELICGTELNQLSHNDPKDYRNKQAEYSSPEDLVRLQHEVDRLYHLEALTESLEMAGDLFFCIIPIVGLIMLVTRRSCDPLDEYTIETGLDQHIIRLTEKLNMTRSLKEVLSNPEDTIFEVVPTDLHPGIERYLKALCEVKQEPIQISTE